MTASANLDSRVSRTDLSLGVVVVVGAGLSIASRLPLTPGLTSLLWAALDSDIEARSGLAVGMGRSDTEAKRLIGDAPSSLEKAWAVIAGSKIARTRFQEQFAELDRERSMQHSVGHEALARLIHAGVVECVISLNWDTALERAYQRLYGTALPRGVLFKPHGDAARPSEPWTLPHEPGIVPNDVMATITRLRAGHARTLLVVGYSESDRVVVEELMKPLDKSWRTIRIGPHATAEGDLQGKAEEVLPLLAERYTKREDDSSSSWHTVPFTGRRGPESWLGGERLGPQDVYACPELDEVETITNALQHDRAVVLNGPTGSGKSITAYQALRRMADKGYEILRLRDHARRQSVRQWLADLAAFPHKKVLFVDDAQDLSPDTVRELAETVHPDQLVLVVGIDHVAGGVRTVHLSALSAVTRLARFVREERATLLPHIRAIDALVGDDPHDWHFERQIEAAEHQRTSWQFAYVLTSGWRRVRRQALELRDRNRADLALLAIAVAQVAGVDSGVPRSELETLVGLLQRDRDWLSTALDELLKRRLVSESDGRFRCSHLQAAIMAISSMLHPPEDAYLPHQRVQIPPIASASSNLSRESQVGKVVPPASTARPSTSVRLPRTEVQADRRMVGRLFEHVLESSATPLRGLTWLIGHYLDSEARWILSHEGVLSDARYAELARRALAVPSGGDITAAAQLLSTLVNHADAAVMDTVRAHASRLAEWYASIAPETAWALGDLANSLYRPDPGFAARVAQFTDGRKLASLILEGGWPHIYSSSHAVARLCSVGRAPVLDAIRPHLDEGAFAKMLDTSPPELHHFTTLIEHLAAADHDLSLRLFKRSVNRIASLLIVDPVQRWGDLFEVVFKVLGYGVVALSRRAQLPKKCRSAARAFVRALDREKVADTLSEPHREWELLNFGVFVGFIRHVDPAMFGDIAQRVDYAKFATSLASLPAHARRTALHICACLWEREPEQVRPVLDGLEPSLADLDPFVAYMVPDVAARALYRGLPLDLELDHHDWGFAAAVVARLAEHDPELAREVVRANKPGMLEGLNDNMMSPFEKLHAWVEACDGLDPGFVDSVLAELPDGAVLRWDRAIKRPGKYEPWHRKEIAPLVHRAIRVGGHVQRDAEALLRRFPALARWGVGSYADN